MKKYVKPELYYENFELSQHIASCYITLSYATAEVCQGVAGGVKPIFTSASCSNEGEIVNAGDLASYCYSNGTGVFTIFLS